MTQWEITAWAIAVAWFVLLAISIAILIRTNRNAHTIEKIHTQTNGLVDKLEVAANKAGQVTGEAKGRKDEQSDERARNRGDSK